MGRTRARGTILWTAFIALAYGALLYAVSTLALTP